MFAKLALVLISAAGIMLAQDAPPSRALVNQGVTAFKSGNYAEAVQSFQKAVDADPTFVTAQLYLATAYMQQYIPGAQSAENQGFADSALREFNKVLDLDPSNKVAVASIASLYLNQKQWDAAQQWYEKMTVLDPSNADSYYSMGFIAWSKWYPAYGDARKQAGMKAADPGPLPAGAVKNNLKAAYLPVIEQGIQNLEKALSIRPQYDDAMAYMNLLIRERADLLDTKADYDRDIAVADDWVQRALAAKRQRAEGVGGPNVPQSIRLSEEAQAQRLLNRVAPVMPADAHASGQVVLNVTVGKDGHPIDIKVASCNPLLIKAAVGAVRQWVYQPTLLNGQPVEVITSVTLTFP
jgi:tetratricopeptide (TPR) repeat protein